MGVLGEANKDKFSGLSIQFLAITILLEHPARAAKLLDRRDVRFLLPKGLVGGNIPLQAPGNRLVLQKAGVGDCLRSELLQ